MHVQQLRGTNILERVNYLIIETQDELQFKTYKQEMEDKFFILNYQKLSVYFINQNTRPSEMVQYSTQEGPVR